MSDGTDADVQALLDIDRLIHEPARLAIMTVLSAAEKIEFKFLEEITGLTKGNLSSHMAKLERAAYVEVDKAFRDRKPVTSYRLTELGRRALESYRRQLRRALPGS